MRRWLIDFTVVWWPEMIGVAFGLAILVMAIEEPWFL